MFSSVPIQLVLNTWLFVCSTMSPHKPQNVRGLSTKTHSCFNNILCTNYDIIIFVETWLCASMYDCELCNDHYDVFRLDKDSEATGKSIGGGVPNDFYSPRAQCSVQII